MGYRFYSKEMYDGWLHRTTNDKSLPIYKEAIFFILIGVMGALTKIKIPLSDSMILIPIVSVGVILYGLSRLRTYYGYERIRKANLKKRQYRK